MYIFTGHGPMTNGDYCHLMSENLIMVSPGTATYLCLTNKARKLLKNN